MRFPSASGTTVQTAKKATPWSMPNLTSIYRIVDVSDSDDLLTFKIVYLGIAREKFTRIKTLVFDQIF